MRDFDLRELQLSELTILEEVDRICSKNNLTYYLAWGSALGAVRHKGFIPWDDDIDVCMPWDDYLKFKEICKSQLNDKFYYQDFMDGSDYYLYWAKIRKNNTTSLTSAEKELKLHWGICIDVFPLFPSTKKTLTIYQRFMYHSLVFLCNKPFIFCNGYLATTAKKLKRILYKFIPESKRIELARKCLFNLAKQKPNYYVDLSEGTKNGVFPYENFGNGRKLLFENKEYVVPLKVEKYLECVYGQDYMKIPDEKDRVDHGNIIVDLNQNYLVYQNKD